MTDAPDRPSRTAEPAWLDPDPAWLGASRPDPDRVAALEQVQHAAGMLRSEHFRQHALVMGLLVVVLVLLTVLGVITLPWFALLLLLVTLGSSAFTVLRTRRAIHRLVEEAGP